MNEIVNISAAKALAVPTPRVPVAIRGATMEDLPFMDSLQKKHSKMVGYFPTKQFEDYIGQGAVLIAEDAGYVIAKDRYLKRDELGVVYQLCVVPGVQRKLVGASLVKAVFDRAAYGCRLFCCWCAQDLEANSFWESMGFVPLAFRAGSGRKKRVHIFWQKRIDGDDVAGGAPWWYPFKTDQGALRADRVVFPIPPGVHWSEVRPVQLPVASGQLPVVKAKRLPNPKSAIQNPKSNGPGPGKVGILVGGRIKYVDRPGYVAPVAEVTAPPATKARARRKPAEKLDPKFLTAARELRDGWLERVNTGAGELPGPVSKYDVSRTITGGARGETRLLPAA